MKRLNAWLEGTFVGYFLSEGSQLSFHYDPEAPQGPISLSLPREGLATRRAAGRFLENLLPETRGARARLATAYAARSTETFDLLSAAGGDLAGGLVLLPEGIEFNESAPQWNPALDRDIAGRIRALRTDPDDWVGPGPQRFSLAGTQGKFALCRSDDDWYWPNAATPSTHILKPARADLRGLEKAEADALSLAARVGVPAAKVEVATFEDQKVLLVERFDRARIPGSARVKRLHTEDLAQAMGIPPGEKYRVTARQALALLAAHDVDPPKLQLAFIKQLVFNTLIGNADAHAKNYSLLLRPQGISLAPLYDAVPVYLYPQYNQDLAMRISGARRPAAVTMSHWRKLARTSQLDEDVVEALVTELKSRLQAEPPLTPVG